MKAFKRIFAVFLSVLILSLSVGDCFFTTKDISRVYAAEFAAGAAAGAAWEWIVALLASIGLGGAAVSNKDAIIDSYKDYVDETYEAKKEMAGIVIDTAVNLYDSATNTVRSIPWDEYVEILKGYHDTAVDSLAGLYAQYCPELLGLTKDYVSSLVNGDIIIAGFNDAICPPLTEEYVRENQWSGEPFDYYLRADHPSFSYERHDILNYPSTKPFCCYISGRVIMFNSGNTKLTYDIYTDNHFSFTYSANGITVYDGSLYAANFPIFSSEEAAENYLLTGDITKALNYDDGIIDNDDLPFLGSLSRWLWERIANASDWGIGSYGAGVGINDWADDTPFLGLDDLQDYIDAIQDVYDGIIDDIIGGVTDPVIDDSYDDVWDDVIDGSIPGDDVNDKPGAGDKDKPANPPADKPIDTPVDEVIDIPGIVPDTVTSLSDISGNLKYKFPFSIPWDLHYLFTVLADTPKTPIFKLPFVIERYGIHETLVIDLSNFKALSDISRLFFSLLYAYGLINWTVKIVSVRKEE